MKSGHRLTGYWVLETFLSETDPSRKRKRKCLPCAAIGEAPDEYHEGLYGYGADCFGTMEVHKKEFLLQPFFEEVIEETKQLCAGKKIGFEADYQIRLI